ncbi:hypothetical protein GCM10025857_04270 [Alicyclobacillus contaminans]|uniref:hypothetical protein n=1 Tax=Alicyclobacillus contaminans TaxID=392016 RepID=UPI0004120C1D|nr:hypothetical protein [Alicyclobacillus contaminans]GMA49070.1 hypothetical protein GCM10025857_04270 [Alicyclobacillus contaminans]
MSYLYGEVPVTGAFPNLVRRFGGSLRPGRFWTFYYLVDDVCAFQEGPFETYSEARRVAAEVDHDLCPLDLWIQHGHVSIWKKSRQRLIRSR